MRVTCPNCAADIPAADVELTTRLAKCRGCDEVFPLPASVTDPDALPPVPPGVKVTDDGLSRRLSFRWFGPGTVFGGLFAIAWDTFLVFWYWNAAFKGPINWFATLFPVGHVAVGVYLKYRVLCELVNRTVIEVGDVLRVWHGPFPWPGGVELPAVEVLAVFCVPVASRGKKAVTVSYTVKAATEEGSEVTLLTGLDTLPRAKFFELTIERWLGLPPTPVPGEALG
jgi:hypothetical protein